MNSPRDIWFVIVTYEPEMDTLRRLIATVEGWPVVLVDNSTKFQILNFKFQINNGNIKYIQTEKNLGYGGGANVGMKIAFEGGATWGIVMNQDVRLTRKGITQFCAMAQNCDPGIIGPETGTLDQKRWTTKLYKNETKLRLGELDYISGSLMAIHRKVWEATGGFYEPYFMYYEDADLSVRAKREGFGLITIEIEGFRHGSVTNVNNDASEKEYYLARNHLFFVQRLAPLPIKLHELSRLPKTLAAHYASGKRQAIEGIADFARRRFGKKL